MRKYVNIGIIAVLAAELGLSAGFQLGLHHAYPAAAFALAAFFFALAVAFGLWMVRFYPDGDLDNKRYALYKGLKALVCLVMAAALMVWIEDRSVRLELLVRFALFYVVQLGLETWEMVHYQKEIKRNQNNA